MAYETRPFIGGRFTQPEGSSPVRNPFTGSVIADAGSAGPKLLQESLDAAICAEAELSKLAPFQRAELLHRISSLIRKRAAEFAELIMLEAGKPISLARAEVQRAAGTFAIAGDEARRYAGELHFQEAYVPSGGKYAVIGRFPVTPVFAITPFNFPLNLTAHKVAPALAVGCAIIHKPSSYTPLTALLLAEVCSEAGIPPGAYNVIPCSSSDAAALVASERVRKISFTGSPAVGWALKAASGRKKVTLELGGNAAVVVDEVNDIAGVAAQVAKGAFAYAGQVCISIQRVLVQEKLYDEFASALVGYTGQGIRSGDPADPEVLNGPLISAADVGRIEEWVAEARAAGAKVLCGGHSDGKIFQPTIIAGAPPEAKVCADEAFAPVAVIAPYRNFSDAVETVNNSRFGLQAGYFTHNLDKANYAYESTQAGAVLVNETPSARLDHLPYGGVKDSGFGREGPRAAMDELTEPRLLITKPGR